MDSHGFRTGSGYEFPALSYFAESCELGTGNGKGED
jgi:hypothetical protein